VNTRALLRSALLLALTVGPARAEIVLEGVLSGGSHNVAMDSVVFFAETLRLTVPTPGWQTSPAGFDTTRFPALPSLPQLTKLHGTVNSMPTTLSIPRVVLDSWYSLPGSPEQARVKFLPMHAVAEPPASRLRRPVLTFSPGIVSGRAVVRASPADRRTRLEILDATGKPVRTLTSRDDGSGGVIAVWNADDCSGREVPEGIYFCRLSGVRPAVGKVIVAR
jgi:hypothetical protein